MKNCQSDCNDESHLCVKAENPLYVEKLKHCEFAFGSNNPQGYEECGEPASYRISWDDQKTWIFLCQKHYAQVDKS